MDPSDSSRANALTSWDRLGFRFCFFGSMALIWIVQARVMGQPWAKAIRGELVGLLPWVFLSPLVLAVWRRFPIQRARFWRAAAAHLGGMAMVFLPYWALRQILLTAWAIATNASGAAVGVAPATRNHTSKGSPSTRMVPDTSGPWARTSAKEIMDL